MNNGGRFYQERNNNLEIVGSYSIAFVENSLVAENVLILRGG